MQIPEDKYGYVLLPTYSANRQGAPLEFHPILCRDKRLNILPNLTAALRHLRRPETNRALWADAICIN
jgi:hypothetical protein